MNWKNTSKITIGNNEYNAFIAQSEADKIEGLSNVEILEKDEGLLFDYSDNPQNSLVFNTKDMNFPIDIIFINDEDEVVAIEYGEPKSDEIIECIADEEEKLKYVLEVNSNSGIQIGDELDFEDEEDDISEEEIDKMYILGSDGKPQMDLVGGERIVSRLETRQLIKKAKKANREKTKNAYKKLGKYMFKILKRQNERPAEYVSGPDNKKGE
jgi:uncharacterized membrane protein (UPF0127 family)